MKLIIDECSHAAQDNDRNTACTLVSMQHDCLIEDVITTCSRGCTWSLRAGSPGPRCRCIESCWRMGRGHRRRHTTHSLAPDRQRYWSGLERPVDGTAPTKASNFNPSRIELCMPCTAQCCQDRGVAELTTSSVNSTAPREISKLTL